MRLRIYYDAKGSGVFDPDAMLFDGDSSHLPAVNDELAFNGQAYTVEKRCFVFHDESELHGALLFVKPSADFFDIAQR